MGTQLIIGWSRIPGMTGWSGGMGQHFGLLPLLGRAPRGSMVGVVVAEAAARTSPIVGAHASGALVGALVAHTSYGQNIWWAFAAFAASVAVGLVASVVRGPLSMYVARAIDGSVRTAATLTLARNGTTAAQVRGDIEARAFGVLDYNEGLGRSVGRAAITQVQNLIVIAAAVGLSVTIAAATPWAACVLFVGAMYVRWRLARQLWLSEDRSPEVDRWARRDSYLLDRLSAADSAKELRIFGLADWLLARHQSETAGYRRLLGQRRRDIVKCEAALAPVVFVLCLVAFLWPALAAFHEDLRPGRLATSVFAAVALFGLTQAGEEQIYLAPGRRMMKSLNELTALPMRAHAHPTPRQFARGRAPTVCFRSVTFGYDADRPVLEDLDLEIGPGERLAVVGLNGAGKSTLVRLLCGLEQPWHGEVLVDDTNLAQLAPDSWHRALAVMPQRFVHYPMSLRHNIDIATTGRSTPEDLAAAISGAGLSEVVDTLPSGIDTALVEGPGASDLSGGQWRRLAIARALMAYHAGARLLILDEPTADLDVAAELGFFADMVSNVPDATVVLISHRMSTVRMADRIVVLDAGRITESGSHNDLIRHRGVYADLFQRQTTAMQGPRPTNSRPPS